MSFSRKVIREAEKREKKERKKFYLLAAKQLHAEGTINPQMERAAMMVHVSALGEKLLREDQAKRALEHSVDKINAERSGPTSISLTPTEQAELLAFGETTRVVNG